MPAVGRAQGCNPFGRAVGVVGVLHGGVVVVVYVPVEAHKKKKKKKTQMRDTKRERRTSWERGIHDI